jgi:hypothetical protein
MLPIHYGICDCFAWPLVVGLQTSRCGRCGIRPEDISAKTQEEADKIFYEKKGYQVTPF